MDAGIQTLSGLFGTPVSYRIPVFQRPYAWTKERQWQPLWSDAQRIAEKLLVAKSGEKIPPHFMGAHRACLTKPIARFRATRCRPILVSYGMTSLRIRQRISSCQRKPTP